jgi:hypothetical protein
MTLKIILYVVLSAASFAAGLLMQAKLLTRNCAPCEYNCPDVVCPPAVTLQAFDLQKMNNRRGNFTYAPVLDNVILVVDCKDSLFRKTFYHQLKSK